MDSRIKDTLTRLDLYIGREANCYFNNPIEAGKIELFEKRNGIKLPPSYKQFLEYTNGGMIVRGALDRIIKRDNDLETAKWNAHFFLSLEEIEEKYNDMESWNFGGAELSGAVYPFIPFFSTNINEHLIFVSLGSNKPESQVFDAFHEETVNTWGMVATDFNEFLINYLDTHGQPDVLGDVEKGMAVDFIETEEDAEERGETSQEIINRTTKKLEIKPNDDQAMMQRGIAFAEEGNLKAALDDYNKSISLVDDNAYYYFNRGDLLMRAGKNRAALIDFDIAVKLEPNDCLYLNCRATVFRLMQKYDKAITDVNKVLQINDRNLLAYYLRESIYRSLGEIEKADKDCQKIEELKEEE